MPAEATWYIVSVVPFDHILGQATAVDSLTRALRSGLVHHAYRFQGPPGVGKTMAALAFAQALLCETEERLGCGRCDACRRVVTVSASSPVVPLHPDVVMVERGLYAPEIIGRKSPEVKDICIEQIRSIVLARFSFPPHEGRARVFIVQRAEDLNLWAANALLKALEEPGDSTYFVLLSSRPDALLDTIRSRTLPIRFGPLSDEVLGSILRRHEVPEELIDGALEVAEGSAEVALQAADPDSAEARQGFVHAVHSAVAARRFDEAVLFAESLGSDRQSLSENLTALAASYASAGRREIASRPAVARLAAERHALVLDAMSGVERNASTKLMICNLIGSLRLGTQARPGTPPGGLPRRR